MNTGHIIELGISRPFWLGLALLGPGLLAFFTFWPAIICLFIGVVRTVLKRRVG